MAGVGGGSHNIKAGELVGKAFLSATVSLLVNKMASPEVWDFFRDRKFHQLLDKLKIKMITINKVLDDAEDKQYTDPIVKQWHDELKDAVYEAEDLLDEIATKVERSKMEAESQTILDKVQDFASSLNPFKTEKLEDILDKLQHLIDQTNALGLKDGIEKSSYQRPPTTSIPDEQVTYGRDDDMKAIMSWMQLDDPSNSNPDVLAIVGMGGLGKTTLAQHVYGIIKEKGKQVSGKTTLAQHVYGIIKKKGKQVSGDSRTDEGFDEKAGTDKGFDEKAWVCVSEEFNVPKITKDILEEFTEKSSNSNNLNQLQKQLKYHLTGKKFFLVLDNVWNEDYLKWQDLLKCLIDGKLGSKILVTTRSVHVAANIQTSPPHLLKRLNDNHCRLVFEKHAFCGTGSFGAHPELERIGRQLIEKCDGLPLAAKVLGGALRSERDPKEWRKILESDSWNLQKDNIFAVLKLSYRFLSSHLKRCFTYCAVFPKNYLFKKEQLIHLWMAEGLLMQLKVNMEIKEVEKAGEDYFDDLVSRSFFQPSTKRECFVMHDLVSDLAKSISREFCFRFGVDRSYEISERIRHLWVEKEITHEVHNHIFTIQHLRTFLCMRWRWPDNINQEEIQNILSTFTRLRVLSLFYYKEIGLPDSIGDLIHLRYLDLSYSSIQKLTNSVVSLSNLEVLILHRCRKLVELPAEISKLVNLCQLDIRGTKLKKMPPHMGKLKKLGELAYFIVGKESDCSSIKELGPLNRLGGHLQIKGLRNVSKVEESVEVNLKCKGKLKSLELIWGNEGGEDSLRERNVLEKLQPHTNIKRLEIDGYGGMRFPDWVGHSSFSNMVELKLIRCRYCSSLPPLGQLGSLKRLSIQWLDEITALGPEFFGNGNKNEDEGGDSFTSFPSLESLVIQKCPKLKEIQPILLPSLTELEIWGCHQLASLPRAPAIRKFEIGDNNRSMILHLPPYSESPSLRIRDWHCAGGPLEILEQVLESPISLGFQELYIEDCDSLRRLPLDLFPKLESLKIIHCPLLESLFLTAASQEEQPLLPSLTELEIKGCHRLASLPRAPAIQQFVIGDDNRCMILDLPPYSESPSLRIYHWHCAGWPLEILERMLESPISIGFKELYIGNYDSLTRFPLDLFPMLESLEIINCPILESLFLTAASQEEQPLPCLEYLELYDCPKLKWLSGCIPSLVELETNECPPAALVNWHRLFPNLTTLRLTGYGEGGWCKEVESFPLEILPSTLTSLQICNFPNLKSLDNEGLQSLTALTELEISWCPNLRQVWLPPTLTSLELEISRCPNLGEVWLPPTLTSLKLNRLENLESLDNWGLHRLTSLTALTLRWLENEESMDNSELHRLTSLTQLEINYCIKLRSLPREGLPSSLTSLTLDSLENLESLDNSGLHRLTSLTQLKIRRCQKLQSLPREGLPSSLTYLTLECLDNLESLDNWRLHRLTCLTQLEISGCRKLRCLPREGLPFSLTSLTLEYLENLESLDNSGLHRLNSLTQLTIHYCQKLQCLPREGLPSSLSSLTLNYLKNLESLDNSGLHLLNSLTQLTIHYCQKLQSLPREGPPSSLQHVDIVNCPLLKVGQDWSLDPPR